MVVVVGEGGDKVVVVSLTDVLVTETLVVGSEDVVLDSGRVEDVVVVGMITTVPGLHSSQIVVVVLDDSATVVVVVCSGSVVSGIVDGVVSSVVSVGSVVSGMVVSGSVVSTTVVSGSVVSGIVTSGSVVSTGSSVVSGISSPGQCP
jgi:hypothetical protein